MPDAHERIKLIAPPPSIVSSREEPLERDRQRTPGVEEHFGWHPFKTKPVHELAGQLEKVKNQVGAVVQALSKSVSDNVELTEIAVGLAISLEGDIGIASAGVEASIELTYKVK